MHTRLYNHQSKQQPSITINHVCYVVLPLFEMTCIWSSISSGSSDSASFPGYTHTVLIYRMKELWGCEHVYEIHFGTLE